MTFAEFWQALRQNRRASDPCLILFAEIPSTHELARRVAREQVEDGAKSNDIDFLAWSQSAGRGRLDHRWSSPAGAGIYASLVRRLPASLVQSLPALVAVALAQALNQLLDGACRLKWPNDLQVDGKKLGGILIEVFKAEDEQVAAVISFGLNHSADLIRFDQERATSVAAINATVSLAKLTSEALAAIDRSLVQPPPDLFALYQALSIHRPGDPLTWHEGDLPTRGTFLGFDQRFFVRLEVEGSERLIAAGELLA